jgi:hypothetical protein
MAQSRQRRYGEGIATGPSDLGTPWPGPRTSPVSSPLAQLQSELQDPGVRTGSGLS